MYCGEYVHEKISIDEWYCQDVYYVLLQNLAAATSITFAIFCTFHKVKHTITKL